MHFLKKIAISLFVILILSISTAAYSIPVEYRDQARNEVEVYILASTHESEPWASVILFDQMCQQVGCNAINGRERLNRQMKYYMQFYTPRMPQMDLP